jgi:hypothetical protein
MADSIHDQWPVATSEWAAVTAQFQAAWVSVFASYDVNNYYAAFAAAIGYQSRMHEDTTVMAGDMITQIAQTGTDNTRGLIQNFQNLQRHVLPQWGALAAAYAQTMAIHYALIAEGYADDRVAVEATARGLAVKLEEATRLAADQAEAQQRGIGDTNSREQAAALVTAEALQRGAGDDNSREQAAAGIKALSDQLTAQIAAVLKYAQSLPGLVDTRAANGYDPTLQSRGTLLTKLLDTAVAHEPLVADLVSKLAVTIIDLAGLEDPVLRIAAQLILKQVIDRLGIDTALGAMINDLVGGILGGGPPRTLQDVMADIGGRLDALENGQAELAPLAPEADDLHEMGTLIFDASLLAYFAAAVADPVATANDTVDVFSPVTTPLLAPVRSLLGMP